MACVCVCMCVYARFSVSVCVCVLPSPLLSQQPKEGATVTWAIASCQMTHPRLCTRAFIHHGRAALVVPPLSPVLPPAGDKQTVHRDMPLLLPQVLPLPLTQCCAVHIPDCCDAFAITSSFPSDLTTACVSPDCFLSPQVFHSTLSGMLLQWPSGKAPVPRAADQVSESPLPVGLFHAQVIPLSQKVAL